MADTQETKSWIDHVLNCIAYIEAIQRGDSSQKYSISQLDEFIPLTLEALIKAKKCYEESMVGSWRDVAADALRENRIDDVITVLRENTPSCPCCDRPVPLDEEAENAYQRQHNSLVRDNHRLREGPAAHLEIDHTRTWRGEQGWVRIGLMDTAQRRSLWVRLADDAIQPSKLKIAELCAGREGDDAYVKLTIDDFDLPARHKLHLLIDVLENAIWAAQQ